MERIHQGYAGQVKYLRGVRDYGTQQLTTIRDQYNDQVIYLYTNDYNLYNKLFSRLKEFTITPLSVCKQCNAIT